MDPPTSSMPKILDGYSYTEWPDLTADRSPLDCIHIASEDIPAHGTTEEIHHAVILSALARILGAYCGASDILLAVQVGQNEDVAFVRMLWDETKLWEELLAESKTALLDAVNQPVSDEVIHEALSLSNSQYPCMALLNLGASISRVSDRYPATLSYHTSGSQLKLSARTTVLHPTILNQIAAQISTLIGHILSHPRAKVAQTPPFPPELMSICERGTEEEVASAYPHLPAVDFAPDYLSMRATDMPSVVAVRWYSVLSLESRQLEFESISYADFHKKANQVARWLLRLGLEEGDRVAVCLDRNLHFHTSMMGIMRAGACYVPIDPELPLERKVYIAKDAATTFVLTSTSIASPEVFGERTLYIEEESSQDEISRELDDDVNCMKLDNIAYLLYTSGTTGNPKGCLLTHRGLSQAILALSSTAADVRMNSTHHGRYLAVASIAFDVHLAETIVPIALGMPLFSARRSQLLENLPIYVKELEITHLGIVPSLIEATLNAAQGGVEGSDIALRYIASGGEKMSDSILDKWANHSQVRLANFYGPSEVTIGCCARYMTPSTPRANIGRSFANVSSYVVDADLNILCRGSVGELVVEGPLVGRGYHGRPDMTAKVFLEWPRPGCWAYRTGDLVRMMPDSTIEIVGRIDTQIKLRGVRIESEGISAIVRKAAPTNDLVLDVTTILAKHPAIGADQLVSLFSWESIPISIRKSKRPEVAVPPPGLLKQIKSKCELELPAYMRPSHFIPLGWLPLSSNGKTDAKILLDIFQKLDVSVLAKLSTIQDSSVSRPCTEAEKKVFEVLRRHVALPFDEPRPDINIFECGLDSMGVIRFVTELRGIFNAKLSASDVMKSPHLSGIASQLRPSIPQSGVNQPSKSLPAIEGSLEEISSIYGSNNIDQILSPFTVQEGVLARSADSDTLYVQHVLLLLKQDASLPKLRQAWNAVSARHSILRQVPFYFSRQVVLRHGICKLQWEEKQTHSEDESSFRDFFLGREALAIARDINQNISTVTPYRLRVYSSAGTTHLVLSIHHALFDGIALPILFQEVERDYFDLDPRTATQPLDILDKIASINLDDAQTFWKAHFSGFKWLPSTLIPSDPLSTQRLIVPFKAPLSSVKHLATVQQVTLQALFTCAFADIAARRIYQRRDVAFGVLRSGRLLPIENIDGALVPLVSVVPIRVDLRHPEGSLRKIQQSISSTIDYEHVPLGKIQGWVRPGHPLFELLFSVSVDTSSASSIWEVIESEPPEPDYPLAVEVVMNPKNDSLLVQAAWVDGEHSSLIRDCLQEFECIVHDLGQNPSLYLGQSLRHLPFDSLDLDDPLDVKGPIPAIDHGSVDLALLNDLRDIISNFLGINPIILTPSMSFVSMGLDSIKSVGLAKALAKIGFSVTSTDLLRNSTLAGLGAHLTSKKSKTTLCLPEELLDPDIRSDLDKEQLTLSEDDIVRPFPTTALQTGMLSQTINSQGKLYVHMFPLRLSPEIEADRLQEAWKTAIRTFAILRTTFHFLTDAGRWVQVVHTTQDLKWSVVSLSGDDDYATTLEDFSSDIRLHEETSFRRPPFWIRLFQTRNIEGKEKPTSLVFAMHHALYDGLSIGKLLEAVETFYRGQPFECTKQFHELLPHFAMQEKEGTPFWLNKLRLHHPGRLQRTSSKSTSATSVICEKYVPFKDGEVKALLTRAAVTAQCIGQAAWAKLISKHTGALDVVFGHTVSGRSIPGAEDVIGPVLNTVLCCLRLRKDMRNIDLLRLIHEFNLEALPWQQASLREIQKALGVNKICDSLFLFQMGKAEQNEVRLWAFDDNVTDRDVQIQYPLNVEMFYDDSGFTLKCASLSDYFDQTSLEELVNDLQQILEEFMKHPNDLICDGLRKLSNGNAHVNGFAREVATESAVILNEAHPVVDPSIYLPILASLTKAPVALIQPSTSLVALGIDSITAIQVIGKFRQAGLKISASDVISSQTIGEMLQKMVPIQNVDPLPEREVSEVVSDDERVAICGRIGYPLDEVEAVSVASSGMKWLIGAWQKSRGTRFQHVFPFELPYDIDIAKLRSAWYDLVQQHPILRSTFACAPGKQEPRVVTFKAISQSSWSEEFVREDVFFRSILERMKTMVSNPPSTSAPFTRALFFGSNRHSYLILHLHHFQYDAWSLRLLVHELSSVYKGLRTNVSPDLRSFLRYFVPNKKHLAAQEQYWKGYFPTRFEPILFPALNCNAGKIPPIRRLIRTNKACIRNVSQYEKRARLLGVSLQSIMLATWARVQGDISFTSSSTFGLWHSGRTGGLQDIGDLAVPCMNVLPMHVSAIERNLLEVAKSIQQDLQRRTSIVEQSDLVQVGEWAGEARKPLCNVFVNIIKVAPDVSTRDMIMQPAVAPYFIPDSDVHYTNDSVGNLPVTQLIKDDIFVDIAVLDKTDSVLMSIDAAAYILDEKQADMLISRWVQEIEKILES
ncbi:hypothetical protein NLJ89_g674 [Agrocybe chaxingu]|uniref:Carrier domain-containing protein n=1 Tax=Agrocybe chaxingu TaxID=84603 RepID=A0A9W8TGA1_9AGAR|nr:hypothetical protein NLJ89_g674 [Agrocybe chaxingu]